jgi:hypothetical protein
MIYQETVSKFIRKINSSKLKNYREKAYNGLTRIDRDQLFARPLQK